VGKEGKGWEEGRVVGRGWWTGEGGKDGDGERDGKGGKRWEGRGIGMDPPPASVYPPPRLLKVTLEGDKRDAGIKTMKGGLLDALDARFAPLMNQAVATISTALDPRFKLKFIEAERVRDEVKSSVLNAALQLSRTSVNQQSDSALAEPARSAPLPDLQPEAENDSPSDAQADEPPDLEAQDRFALHIIIIKCIYTAQSR